MTLPGRVMLSEQECLSKVRKPLMGKGKKANKQVIDRNGNPVWVTVKEPNPMKHDRQVLRLIDNHGNEEAISVLTRKSRPASKTININKEAYNYFISAELPEGFHTPRNFKPKVPPFKKPINLQAWLTMSKEERLEWHLMDICASMGGTLVSYNVFED